MAKQLDFIKLLVEDIHIRPIIYGKMESFLNILGIKSINISQYSKDCGI